MRARVRIRDDFSTKAPPQKVKDLPRSGAGGAECFVDLVRWSLHK